VPEYEKNADVAWATPLPYSIEKLVVSVEEIKLLLAQKGIN
jgi:hypothetical protein